MQEEIVVDVSFTSDEVKILRYCLDMAEMASVGKKVRERWFSAVADMKEKLLVAEIQLDAKHAPPPRFSF